MILNSIHHFQEIGFNNTDAAEMIKNETQIQVFDLNVRDSMVAEKSRNIVDTYHPEHIVVVHQSPEQFTVQDQAEIDEELNKIRPESQKSMPKLSIDCSMLQNASPLEQLSAISSALRSPFLFEAVPIASLAAERQNDDAKKIRTHSPETERVYSCPDCEKSFTQQAHLSIHQRKHTGERPYLCPYEGCGKKFTQFGNLKTHERKHTGERPFKCPFPGCGKAFSQMGNMKTHLKLHDGVRPYPCNVSGCTKSFTQLGNLKSHQIKVHPDRTQFDVKKRKPRKAKSPSSTLDSSPLRSIDEIPQNNLPPRKRKISSIQEGSFC